MDPTPARKDDNLILVLNSGSSSLKFGAYRQGTNDEEPVLTGGAESSGRSNRTLRIHTGKTVAEDKSVLESQGDALTALATAIKQNLHAPPKAVGHRVVHGGPDLRTHQLITPRVVEQLRAATHFAPLHIPQALALIASAQTIFPDAAHYACFDNAFHRTLPEVSAHLPLPQRYYDAGIRRYGFHGLSYESLVHHFGAHLPERAIFAHLGSGASVCALQNGVSIDTTMGLTPTGGIPMGTRTGDLDPGVLVYLLRTEKFSTDELEDLLNHQSGLSAFAGGGGDARTLEERARAGDPKAKLALDAFSTAVRKVIGSYVALLGGVDLLVFTGGIGEHSEGIRRSTTQGLECLGLTPDKIKVVPTEEELQIARHVRTMMKRPQGNCDA